MRTNRAHQHAATPGGRLAPTAIPERHLRCLWYDGRRFLKPDIRTRDGRDVRILSPGDWNTGRGPDFFGGVFKVGRRGTVCGDVEVHRHRHDWHRHAHRRDPAFGGVRLHVFLLDDGNGALCQNSSGGAMTEICLRGQTRRALGEAARLIDPRRYPYRAGEARGRCGAAARNGGGERLAGFLRSAGEARLREKAARARRLARRCGAEQTLYRLILETLGYSAHKGAFIRLAEALPWRTLRRIAHRAAESGRRAIVESALMGVAGLIPAAPRQGWDSESVRAWRGTRREWEALRGTRELDELPGAIWRTGARRPTNSPHRRIAGISSLLAGCVRTGLCAIVAAGARPARRGDTPGDNRSPSDDAGPRDSGAVTVPTRHVRTSVEGGRRCRESDPGAALRELGERLDGLLDGGGSTYWRRRCSWGGAALRVALAPIGREHRLKIIANVLLPVMWAEGARETARGVLRALPAVEPDSRVKTMMTRLVGGGTQFPRQWGMAAQQGMLHLHRHFCAKDRSGCLRCPLPALLARFPSLP